MDKSRKRRMFEDEYDLIQAVIQAIEDREA
jgi:hypothetical protein